MSAARHNARRSVQSLPPDRGWVRALVVAVAVLGGGLAPGLATAAPRSSGGKTAPPKLSRVRIVGDAADNAALADKLRLRRPDLEFEAGAGPRGPEDSELVVTRAAGRIRLDLKVPDGRTYRRQVPGDSDIGTRAVAADVAAFVNAVERGTVQPEPATAGRSRSRRNHAPDSLEPSLSERLAAALQLGAGIGPSLTVPLAVGASARAGTFAGGMLTVRAQTLRNVIFELGTRVGGKRAAGHRLLRSRVGFGAGYRYTHGRFDLPATAALTVEPWSVRPRTEQAPSLRAPLALGVPPSLVGLAIRAFPAMLVPLPGGAILRLGGGVELATSAAPRAGAGAVRATTEEVGAPVFRVGGLETTFTAEFGFWIPWSAIRRKPD